MELNSTDIYNSLFGGSGYSNQSGGPANFLYSNIGQPTYIGYGIQTPTPQYYQISPTLTSIKVSSPISSPYTSPVPSSIHINSNNNNNPCINSNNQQPQLVQVVPNNHQTTDISSSTSSLYTSPPMNSANCTPIKFSAAGMKRDRDQMSLPFSPKQQQQQQQSISATNSPRGKNTTTPATSNLSPRVSPSLKSQNTPSSASTTPTFNSLQTGPTTPTSNSFNIHQHQQQQQHYHQQQQHQYNDPQFIVHPSEHKLSHYQPSNDDVFLSSICPMAYQILPIGDCNTPTSNSQISQNSPPQFYLYAPIGSNNCIDESGNPSFEYNHIDKRIKIENNNNNTTPNGFYISPPTPTLLAINGGTNIHLQLPTHQQQQPLTPTSTHVVTVEKVCGSCMCLIGKGMDLSNLVQCSNCEASYHRSCLMINNPTNHFFCNSCQQYQHYINTINSQIYASPVSGVQTSTLVVPTTPPSISLFNNIIKISDSEEDTDDNEDEDDSDDKMKSEPEDDSDEDSDSDSDNSKKSSKKIISKISTKKSSSSLSNTSQSPESKAKGHWTKEEDERLKSLVDNHGTKRWKYIATLLCFRNGRQCRERWSNQLDPSIKRDAWSIEEDRIILEAHSKFGNKWAEISKLIPGRTNCAIKNHWNSTMKRKLSKKQYDDILPSSNSSPPISSSSPNISDSPVKSESIDYYHYSDSSAMSSNNNLLDYTLSQQPMMNNQIDLQSDFVNNNNNNNNNIYNGQFKPNINFVEQHQYFENILNNNNNSNNNNSFPSTTQSITAISIPMNISNNSTTSTKSPRNSNNCWVCESITFLPPKGVDFKSNKQHPLTREHCQYYEIPSPPVGDTEKKYFVCHAHHNSYRRQNSKGIDGTLDSNSTSNNNNSRDNNGYFEISNNTTEDQIISQLRENKSWEHLENILKMKNENTKSDTCKIDLLELYNTLLDTKSTPLEDCYTRLYQVFNIKAKVTKKKKDEKDDDLINKKLIKNNIKFKIKNLLVTFPHLKYYGSVKEFHLQRLQRVPEILLVIDNPHLKKKFLE